MVRRSDLTWLALGALGLAQACGGDPAGSPKPASDTGSSSSADRQTEDPISSAPELPGRSDQTDTTAGNALASGDGMRDVLLVGNSVSGTVSFVDAHTFENLGSVNVIPDIDKVLATIDNTVTILSTEDLKTEAVIDVGLVPCWATTSPDGRYCFVSLSGDGSVSVIDYAAGKEVKEIPVGTFPQRSRLGQVPESVISLLSKAKG